MQITTIAPSALTFMYYSFFFCFLFSSDFRNLNYKLFKTTPGKMKSELCRYAEDLQMPGKQNSKY